jgi:predicted nucleic acid-binding protein
VIVLLDAGPLGLVTNPRATLANLQCKQWFAALLAAGVTVLVPEIADYEVRRELIRSVRTQGIARLDQLNAAMGYVAIDTPTMLLAAELWAQARRQGQPTTVDAALDGDAILAAQAILLARRGDPVVIATTNVRHVARFAPAQRW